MQNYLNLRNKFCLMFCVLWIWDWSIISNGCDKETAISVWNRSKIRKMSLFLSSKDRSCMNYWILGTNSWPSDQTSEWCFKLIVMNDDHFSLFLFHFKFSPSNHIQRLNSSISSSQSNKSNHNLWMYHLKRVKIYNQHKWQSIDQSIVII